MTFHGQRYSHIAGITRTLTEFGLVIALAWSVAGIFFPPGGAPVSSPALQKKQLSGTDNTVSIQDIIAVDLFGKQPPKQQVAHKQMKKPAVAMPTHRSMVLLGTVVAGAQSVALMVPERGEKQDVYYIGDSILPGVVLKRIEKYRVFIEADGKQEVVMLAGIKHHDMMPVRHQEAPAISGSKRNLSRVMLDRELNNFSKLLSQARVSPAMQDGKSMGFRLAEIVPGSLYARIGLHNGDVVQTVNGIRIQNPSQAMAMYRKLHSEKHIRIQLLRNGREQTFSYDIQ